MKRLLLFVFIGTFVFFACRRHDSQNESQFQSTVLEYNVHYGNHPQQTMDVYIPAGVRDTMGLIVLVHGGSWYQRDKSDFAPWFDYERGLARYAVININYRLDTPTAPPVPQQTDDIASAIDALNSKYNFPANRIILFGLSSGSHISSLYAYRYANPQHIKGVINFVGPVDFNDPQYHTPGHWQYIFTGIEYIFNHPYQGNENYYAGVSPYHYINASTPPSILFYGGADTLVPPTQGQRLHARLDSAGVENEFYLYPNSGHIFNNADGWDAARKAQDFIQRHL